MEKLSAKTYGYLVLTAMLMDTKKGSKERWNRVSEYREECLKSGISEGDLEIEYNSSEYESLRIQKHLNISYND